MGAPHIDWTPWDPMLGRAPDPDVAAKMTAELGRHIDRAVVQKRRTKLKIAPFRPAGFSPWFTDPGREARRLRGQEHADRARAMQCGTCGRLMAMLEMGYSERECQFCGRLERRAS